MALRPPFSISFESMNWRRQKSKSSAICCFSSCPTEKTISLSFMPWHHQPPINTQKVEQVLSMKPTTTIVKLWKDSAGVREGFLLRCFCVELREKVVYGKNIRTPKFPRCKQRPSRPLYLCSYPSPPSAPARTDIEAFVLWGTECNLPSAPCQGNSFRKVVFCYLSAHARVCVCTRMYVFSNRISKQRWEWEI